MRNKYLMIAATMALALGVASAQTDPNVAPPPADETATPTTTATPAAAVTNFTDIPAGHWAKDAVDLIVKRGLIQGFPDGTFRGSENLTRYQAALIFARLLQSGGLSAPAAGLSATDLATITKGIQDVATELAALSSRVDDLEKASTAQQASITALETQIAGLSGGTSTADTAAMTARIDALETAIQNIPAPAEGPAGPAGADGAAGPAGPAGPAANVDALTARVTALEAQAAAPAPSTSTTTTVDTTTAAAPTTVVVGDSPDTTMMAAPEGNSGLYFGITTAAVFSGAKGTVFGRSVPFVSDFGATVGASNVLFGLGVRANVDYRFADKTVQGDVNAIYTIGNGRFAPYVGLGAGLVSSTSRTTPANKASDYYINGVVGVESKLIGGISSFAEFDGKYYLSNKGVGTNSTSAVTTARTFSPAIKLGLKYYF
ncbi:S-layer homology domain-containing protein [Deinococcus sp.]|uniref:S-layer homology domain-containing protein n=1 Tax=Deinococcus sp. TaxID=47478 RepID=UPI0025F04A9D|nr:S-layer homology domain-containing protein [Deinococcus sp.]